VRSALEPGCGSESEGERIYNSQVVIDPRGEIAAKYRKTHLFAPSPIEEDKFCAAGASLTTVDLDSLRLGLAICYDLRFPEIFRALAIDKQASVFAISSAWPFPRLEHLRILTSARAIENQSYLILANRVGKDEGVQFCGNSAIIDPKGETLAFASSEREEILLAEISEETLRQVRAAMPVFAHRRIELYAKTPPIA
jgi:omega-amidase